jgi:hypothetical protein
MVISQISHINIIIWPSKREDKMKSKDVKFGFVALLALSIFVPTSAGFTVSGALFIDVVSPGEEILHEITVTIDEDSSPQNMIAVIGGFATTPEGADYMLDPDDDIGPYTARPFLIVSPERFQLQPGEPQKVLVTGTVPEDIGAGGRYALVGIKTEPDPTGNVAVTTAILVPVLLQIDGSEIVETGEITDLEVLESDEGVIVALMFENTGNYHYKPIVEAVIKGEDGDDIATATPQQSFSSVRPSNSWISKMNFDLDEELAPGTYTVEARAIKEDGTVLDTEETTFEV